MDEATLRSTEHGLEPADGGWYVANLADVRWSTVAGGGTWCLLESADAPWEQLGFGIHVLGPGESAGYYHAEDEQEGFLVIAGACIAIVEGQERPMRVGDYLHSPAGTAHMIVGAGDGPCVLAMVGTRSGGATHYLVDDTAARHGVSVETQTDSAREAYRDRPPIVPGPPAWPNS